MRTALRTVVVLVALGTACKGTPSVGLSITLPRDLTDKTVWFEVGAFKDASCTPLVAMLPNGVPEGSTARSAFRRDDGSPPTFGRIPNGKYAFAATARDENCAVLAVGCKAVDVGDTSDVVVILDPTSTPTGTCTEGASCQAARCVPANDNRDPSVGAGCSLELLGAGPLATPVGGAETLVSAPAIAPTSSADGKATGFVIAYREIDPSGSGARVTILPIDTAGGALSPLRPALPNPCPNSDETDGVGLVINKDTAMLALAKAPCGDKPELQLLNFRSTPELGKFLVSPSPNGVRVSLGAARAAATRPQGNLVVFTEGGVGRIANMDPEKGIIGPNGSFGGLDVTDTWVAASDRVLALLAVGSGRSGPVGDGGADSGGVDPPLDAESTLRLLMVPANTAVDGIVSETNTPRAPISFPGVWGAVAAVGGRVIVLSDGTGGRSATYRAFDLNKDTPSDSSGFSVEGPERVTAGDVAIVGNRAYFATLKQGAVALNVYESATTSLVPLRSVAFSRETRISAIGNVRDGRVAVAATDARVAVVWTTAKVLTSNDPTGGYAVFGCTK